MATLLHLSPNLQRRSSPSHLLNSSTSFGCRFPSVKPAAIHVHVHGFKSMSTIVAQETISIKPEALVRPTPAESARTLAELCTEGTISTLTEDGWPFGTTIRFVVDPNGNPLFKLRPSSVHTRNLLADNRCSLQFQLKLPSHRAECTLSGRVCRVQDSKTLEHFRQTWEVQFGIDFGQNDLLYILNVERALQSHDIGEEEVSISGPEYVEAEADPLKGCAARIVEDINSKHWQDLPKFCRVYGKLNVEIEQASLTWVDHLGFDMRVLTSSPQEIREIRIPFPREVTDEKDARSSLTMMAQIAWEEERRYFSSLSGR